MSDFSNILVNIFLIALISFALLGGLYNLMQLFTFIRDSVIISKNEKYNLYIRTECEGIFLYKAYVRKEGKTDTYPNIPVEVKVVSHYQHIFHKPTQEQKSYLIYTTYELQSIRWEKGGYEDFVDSENSSFDNKLIMEHETTVKSTKGNTFRVKLTSQGVDTPFQQVRDLKKKEQQLRDERNHLKARLKVYETLSPELKKHRYLTLKEARILAVKNNQHPTP